MCVLLLGVLGFTMSLQFAIGVPALVNNDEQAHASYAIALSRGVLPTVDTADPLDPSRYPQVASILFGQDAAHREIWTANHPPLYYALCVPLVWLGDAVGHPGVTLLGMRLVNALGYAASIVLVGLLAGELVPRRRVVPVLASAMLLACGAVPFDGGSIYNDGLGTATAFLTLLLGFRMIRTGVTRERVVWAAVAGVAAASTRSTGLVAVLILGASVLAALWLRDPTLRTLRRGVVTAVWIGLAPVVAIGWFYVRNAVLYGDLTGSAYLFEKFGRATHGTTLYQVVNPEFWGQLLGGLWADEKIPKHWMVAPVVILVLTVAGLAADHAAKQRPRAGGLLRAVPLPGAEPGRTERLQELAVRALTVAYAVIVAVNVAAFTAGGGWLHARYALPLLPLVATGTSLALLRLGRCVRRLPAGTEPADLRITLVASVAFVVVGLVCHADIQGRVDAPATTLWLVALVASDVLLLAVAAYVVGRLRGLLRPAVFGLSQDAAGPVSAEEAEHRLVAGLV